MHFSFAHLDADWAPMVQSLVPGYCCAVSWQIMESMKEHCLGCILLLSPSLPLNSAHKKLSSKEPRADQITL